MPGIVSDLLRAGHAPESIAFVSYSRAAVREAVDRVERCTGIPAAMFSNFRTLHSSWTRRLDLGPNAFLTEHDFAAFAKAIATGITPHDEDESDDGLPMLGDDLYGGPVVPWGEGEPPAVAGPGDERIALHAVRIAYADPDAGDAVVVEAPLPDSWPLTAR